MATAKLNEAWWKKNKAKTLLKTGVGQALKNWQAALKSGDPAKILKALTDLDKTANKAIAKANKKLHKETIGYLSEYERQCQKIAKMLHAANGATLWKNRYKKAVAAKVQKDRLGVMYAENLLFMADILQQGQGSAALFDKYISKKAPLQINIREALVKLIETDSSTGNFALTSSNWGQAVKDIKFQVESDSKPEIMALMRKIELEPVLKTIKSI